MKIRNYRSADHDSVISLWLSCFDYPAPHNNPEDSIRRKLALKDNLFFLAVGEGSSQEVLGTIMAGWDGHRGWLYSLAVGESVRKQGIGTTLVKYAVATLGELDCPKVNLQVMPGNSGLTGFYEKLGFEVENRVSMGCKLY